MKSCMISELCDVIHSPMLCSKIESVLVFAAGLVSISVQFKENE